MCEGKCARARMSIRRILSREPCMGIFPPSSGPSSQRERTFGSPEGVAARSRIRRWRCRRASMALEGRRCWHSKQSLVGTTGGVSLPPRIRHWGYYSEEAPSRGRCWRVERRREGDEGPRSSPAPRGSVKRSRLRCHFVRRASAPPRVQWRSLILLCQVTRGVLGQGACACVCACMCACARTCVYVYVSGASI